tara:strand:+ start:774 stop:2993 length:2220 start_codon:yes stop_codon:yes gene_type:complete
MMRISDLHRVLILAAIAATAVVAAPEKPERGNEEYRAYSLYKRALGYLETKNDDQAEQLLADIPRLFPKTSVRFRARLALGAHFVQTRRFPEAIEQFRALKASDEPDQRAEALYRMGICHYEMNAYDQAFVSLRQVTTTYPWSVWANESYYYIGLCHFQLKRWTRAYEALKRVGLSVAPNQEHTSAEAGQRLWIKVADKDLVSVLRTDSNGVPVTVQVLSGDREVLLLRRNNEEATESIASIETTPGAPVPDDGRLQLIGNDLVTVTYVDETTGDGVHDHKVVASIRMVSTAAAGFTDGAYRDYADGLFGNQAAFVRVKDLDENTTPMRDTVRVRVATAYRRAIEETAPDDFASSEPIDPYVERDVVFVNLTESEKHSGIFHGMVVPALVTNEVDGVALTPAQLARLINQKDDILTAIAGDRITMEYVDTLHLEGEESRALSYSTIVLSARRQDVEATQWVVRDQDLRARKNIVEAQIFLKLGQIFKEVGLQAKAVEKASLGLDRVDVVIRQGLDRSVERVLVEEAFSIKWDLQLVQDRLRDAVTTCNALLKLFPESTVADKALLKIGIAKLQSDYPDEWEDAASVFRSIQRLKTSDLKAEAQFRLAETLEKIGYERQKDAENPTISSAAIVAYRTCANRWPDTVFAGLALEKIVQFYIDSEDYTRAIDMMEMVFQDFEDAAFLDVMLLKWAIAAHRLGHRQIALEKLHRLIAEYSDSKVIRTAVRFRERLERADVGMK